ncbi:MAG: tRNA threonylcarbamoyladenosine dehydratase [Thiomonas sp. 20-64-5]|nr:MAG: tRNA threonylcarbamoyladenosine dehydratase [Thiomonas sp. 20-64-5]
MPPPRTPQAQTADRRFSGLARLYGEQGAQRIAQAHAVIVGLGGVGSWAAEALARCGVGRLTLIDLDHVAQSNINRQIQALDNTLGMSKVLALQERFAQINPECGVVCIEDFVEADNAAALIPADAQLVLDCCDQVRAKAAIAALCLNRSQPLFMAGAAGGKRHADALQCADLADVTHDPLLANVRYQLRRQHGAPRTGRIGVLCAFSREVIVRPESPSCDPLVSQSKQTDNSLNCAGFGSSVMVTASMGMMLAARAIDTVL